MIQKLQSIVIGLCALTSLLSTAVALFIFGLLFAGRGSSEESLLPLMIALFVAPVSLAAVARLLHPYRSQVSERETDA